MLLWETTPMGDLGAFTIDETFVDNNVHIC